MDGNAIVVFSSNILHQLYLLWAQGNHVIMGKLLWNGCIWTTQILVDHYPIDPDKRLRYSGRFHYILIIRSTYPLYALDLNVIRMGIILVTQGMISLADVFLLTPSSGCMDVIDS